MITDRPLFTLEANEDAEKQIDSLAYYLNVQGGNMRDDGKDFHLTAYMLTHLWDPPKGFKLEDINVKPTKYKVK